MDTIKDKKINNMKIPMARDHGNVPDIMLSALFMSFDQNYNAIT